MPRRVSARIQGARRSRLGTTAPALILVLASLGLDDPSREPVPRQVLQPTREQAAELDALNAGVSRLRRVGRLTEAIAELRRMISCLRDHFGTDHLGYPGALFELARMLQATGDFEGSKPVLDEAVRAYESVLGARNPEFAFTLNDMACDLGPLASRQAIGTMNVVTMPAPGRGVGPRDDRTGAVGLFEKALAIRKEVRGARHPDYALSLLELAAYYMVLGDRERPGPMFEEALAILKGTPSEREPFYSRGLSNFGIYLKTRGQFAQADALYQQALSITRERLGDRHPDYAVLLANLGHLSRAQGRPDEAEGYLERARAVLGEAGRTAAEYQRLHRIFGQLKAENLWPAAVAVAREMVRVFERPGSPYMHPDHVHSLADLGQSLFSVDDDGFQLAYERAAEVARAIYGERDPRSVRYLTVLSIFLAGRGDQAGARRNLEKALSSIREGRGEHQPEYATNLDLLGKVLIDQGDFDGAEAVYEKALTIRKELLGEWHSEFARSLDSLATVLMNRDDPARAIPLLKRALAVLEVRGEGRSLDAASVLNNLGFVAFRLGDLATSQASHERALAIRKEQLGEEHPITSVSLNNLATLLALRGETGRAESLFETAIALAEKSLSPHDLAKLAPLVHHGMILQWRGDLAGARRDIERALEIAEWWVVHLLPTLPERERLALLEKRRVFLGLALTLSDRIPDQDEPVYRHVLAWKGASAGDLRSVPVRPELSGVVAELNAIRSAINTLYYSRVDPEKVEDQAREIWASVDRRSRLEARLADVLAREGPAPSPRDVAAALPARAALVDFLEYSRVTYEPRKGVQSEDRMIAFITRPASPPRRVDLGPTAAIRDSVARWRAAIQADDADPGPVAGELARVLWVPLAPFLAGIDTVVVAPDGDLHFVPWGALPGETPGSYLLERYAFVTALSGRHLVELGRAAAAPARAGLLAVGGVDYSRAEPAASPPLRTAATAGERPRSIPAGDKPLDFPPLPGTRREAEAIADLFSRYSSARSVILSGSQATKARLRAALPGTRYIHLATHGYFAPPDLKSALAPDDHAIGLLRSEAISRRELSEYFPGLLSALVWAGASSPARDPVTRTLDLGEAVMTAEEVAGLDLSGCELVVLSACETGLGRVAGGEGVLGLQRAFRQAGARAVIASLWKVDDETTQALMLNFYENLWRKRMTKLESLRQAQLALLRGELRPDVGAAGRGLDRKTVPFPARNQPVKRRTPPAQWAAFMLGGQWRD